jgi:small subunit ribosomal protein S24e
MEIQIISEKQNPLLKRKEVQFLVDHGQTGSTPPRLEIRRAVAAELKTAVDMVFVRKFETKTGTHTAYGVANVYASVEQAKLIEPGYIIKRNVPQAENPKEEKPKEGVKGQNA